MDFVVSIYRSVASKVLREAQVTLELRFRNSAFGKLEARTPFQPRIFFDSTFAGYRRFVANDFDERILTTSEFWLRLSRKTRVGAKGGNSEGSVSSSSTSPGSLPRIPLRRASQTLSSQQ